MIAPWILRRRMMMSAPAGVDVANLLIQGSCTFTDYGIVTMGDGNNYRLLAITQSGNLVFSDSVSVEVCVVGGGANGLRGMGGAGAYLKNQTVLAYSGGEVIIGAAQGASAIAGINVTPVSGANGGTGGGGYDNGNGGIGDGLSKYPFGDATYTLWASKPHCAGGGGSGSYHKYNDVDGDYSETVYECYTGGSGGTNGGNGNKSTYSGLSTYGMGTPGKGGAYGGGQGLGKGYAGGNATYYGSAGGGNDYAGSVGAGYQGIVYVRIPVDQSILEAA